jgi:hypothetical protein
MELVILSIILIVIVVLILVSAGIGAWLSFEGKKANSQDVAVDRCAQCKLDQEWYESKPGWLQATMIVWWAANRLACKMNGC